MKIFRKIGVYFLIVGLVFSVISTPAFAAGSAVEETPAVKKLVVDVPEREEKAILYEEDNRDSKQLIQIENGAVVFVLEEGDEYTHVQYEVSEQGQIWDGYIESSMLMPSTEAEEALSDSVQTDSNATKVQESASTDSGELASHPTKSPNEQNQATSSPMTIAVGVELEGITTQNETNVYDSASASSTILTTYKEGSILKLYDYSPDWYVINVKVDGADQTGYIQKSRIDLVTSTKVKYEGIAVKGQTNLFAAPTKGSEVLKIYNQGSILLYYSYTSQWFQTSVNVNGEFHTVYLNKDDVEQVTLNPEKQEGFALKDPTPVYASPSRNSQVLRTFNRDSFLLFYTYTSEWYKSTVNVNGKLRTIYINKTDVEKPANNSEKHKGIALINPTNMYSTPTKGSKVLKTYRSGAALLYYSYSSKWYKSSVTYNGAPQAVYIYRDDVDQITNTPEKQEGIALKNPTNLYASPTRDAKALKTFKPGSIMKYYSYSPNWKMSYVTVNGKVQTIYIHKDDIEQVNSSAVTLQGVALKSPTKVYSLPSGDSKVLKEYKKSSLLKYYNYSKNWYKSYVNINGKSTICYIKKTDVGSQKSTAYDLSLKEAVTMQLNAAPLTDSSSTWKPATSKQVEYYLNPLNFPIESDAFLQFLILSNPAGTNATEINNRILYGKGVLAGKGSSFIEAAKTYQINEIYLISHSLLETGNGTSKLATGIKVNGVKVYNVYGVGAYDRNPDYYGAQFAYDHGWTSVEKAIIGGAQFVSENYIHAGQDTLYKMRWNPDAMETYGYASHQYASDIGWAIKQTKKMAQMFSSLTQYTLLYDLPLFK